ncbi:hypothetical protein ACVDFE_41310 [Lentzea chajnantorensis]
MTREAQMQLDRAREGEGVFRGEVGEDRLHRDHALALGAGGGAGGVEEFGGGVDQDQDAAAVVAECGDQGDGHRAGAAADVHHDG